MKIIRCLTPAVLFFSMQLADAQVYSQNIVGYLNRIFSPGYSLFANTFDYGSDTLSDIFTGYVPNNTTVSLWNSTTGTFDTTSTFQSGHWSVNLTMQPGTGARLQTSTSFTNTFVGTVMFRDGTTIGDIDHPTLPPVYSGPAGVLLLGDILPMFDTGTNIFLNILGRAPHSGEQVTTLNSVSQSYTTSTYLGNGSWDTAPPTLNVSDAAFLTVTSVPEPSVMAFGIFGAGVLVVAGRRHRKAK